ncbi:MAG: hypothetical protein DRH57_01255 [Candidatus Cloacimonadota bacterium]|nr:MAG: hypothetical protein DRH57_01255 [Candidatus Cloacimonadota bacterium]
MNIKNINIVKLTFYLIVLFAVILCIYLYKFIISYLIVSFLLAYLISPLVHYFERYHIKRTLSILFIYVIIAVILTFFILGLIPQIVDQIIDFTNLLTEMIQKEEPINLQSIGLGKLDTFFEKIKAALPFIKFDQYNELLSQRIGAFIGQLPQIVIKSISGIFAGLSFLIIVPVIGFFLLRDEDTFRKNFFRIIPNRYFEFTLHLFQKIEESFGRFFRALLIETLIVTILSVVGLLALDIKYALILGIIIGLSNPIKYFGPIIGIIPALIVVLASPKPNIYVIYVLIVHLIIQQIDSIILFPSIMGKEIKMHPLLVLLTVIAGGYAFGILGMFFTVPAVYLIKTIMVVSYNSLRQFEII